MTIPVVYGRAKSALYLIWEQNYRHGAGAKATKKSNIIGNIIVSAIGVPIPFLGNLVGSLLIPSYVENVDFLACHNPAMGPLQFWLNQTQSLPLNFTKYSQDSAFIGPASITISDPNFYSVLGVTITTAYGANLGISGGSVTFNDYGGQGPQTYTGTYEVPLWNLVQSGPNPTDPTGHRMWPYVYIWQPGDNTVILPAAKLGLYPIAGYTINIYYAQLDPSGANLYNKKNEGTAVPAGALRLTFEPVLGDGPEFYSPGNFDFRSQQIQYPHYCGLGSPNIDLGTGSAIPDIRPEVQGSFPIYSTGDGDFADMIEDTFNGATQAGVLSVAPRTPLQHGLNCQNFPGATQIVDFTCDAPNLSLVTAAAGTCWTYPLPNTAGNMLVVAFATGGGSITGITDTAGNSWTQEFGSPTGEYQVWTAIALAYSAGGVGTTINITWTYSGEPTAQFTALEVAGVDTLDAVTVVTASNVASVVSSGAAGNPEYLLAFGWSWGAPLDSQAPPAIPLWNLVAGNQGSIHVFYGRVVYYPGTFTITFPSLTAGSDTTNISSIVLFAFSNSQPVNYPKALGDILDHPSLDLCRSQCRAAGLYGSLVMDSTKAAKEWGDDLYTAMDAAPVWSGFKLKSIPYSEQSAVGNGAIYVAPTASGPIYNLTRADYVVEAGKPPVTIERTAQLDRPDLLQIQCPSRSAQYNPVVVSQPETASIALYGTRKADPKVMNMFQDPAVARMVLGILTRKANYLPNVYTGTLPARFKLAEAMDLYTIAVADTMPDESFNVPKNLLLPVRFTKLSENENLELDFEAEDFIYGTYAPLPLSVTTQAPYVPQTGASAGNVNTPLIFEPNARLAGEPSQGQIWLSISSPATNYGGCQVYLSIDGGLSYTSPGGLVAPAVTGILAASWPAAADPDTSNDLMVDLSESFGTLASFSLTEENSFQSLCIVSGQAYGAYVRGAGGHSTSSTVTAAFASNTAGNTIIAIVTGEYNAPNNGTPLYNILSISDTAGNLYEVIASTVPTGGPGVLYSSTVFRALNINASAGTNTLTVTGTNVTAGGMILDVQEFYGINFLDTWSLASASGGVDLSTGEAEPSMNGDFSMSWFCDMGSSSDTITPSTGWVQRLKTIDTGNKVQVTWDRTAGDGFDNEVIVAGATGPVQGGCMQWNTCSGSQIGLVQPQSKTTEGGSTNSQSFIKDNIGGNSIVIAIGVSTSMGVPTFTITDTNLNAYSFVFASPAYVGTQVRVYRADGIVAGANTITITWSTGDSAIVVSAAAHEFPPLGVADGMNSTSGFGGAYPFSQSSGGVSAENGDLMFSVVFDGSNNTDIFIPTPQAAQATQTFAGGSRACAMATYINPANNSNYTTTKFTTGAEPTGTSYAFHVLLIAFRNPNPPVLYPYELMAYGDAVLTSGNDYTLKATGAGNELRRAVYGQPLPGQGDAHLINSRFAFIGQGSMGIFKYTYDPALIGTWINFKIASFNNFVGGLQLLSDVTSIAYLVQGTASSSNPNSQSYTQSPMDALSNPTATTIGMVQVTTTFPSNTVIYNARTLTIPGPSSPTQYFVTVYDPAYLGDTGSMTNLTAQAETSQEYVGKPGYTYIGSIIVLPGGGGTSVTPGGLPVNLGSGGASVNFAEETPSGPLNGANQTFTLSFAPNPATSLFLFLNGVQQVLGVDYTFSGATIIFTVAPISTDEMIAQYTH